MDNPHEERQAVLLERIIKNVDKCNESLLELNRSLHEIIGANQDAALASTLFTTYGRNVVYNLEAIGRLEGAK